MRRAALILLLLALARPASAQQAFTVGPVTAQAGTLAAGMLQVAARAGDSGTTIPITVINGSASGPVLALIAGTHGMEYVPIVALQRMRETIDPKTLKGTIVMVHVANMPSFLGRTIYYSPTDGKNLNRVFPGNANGTLSERIADVITREVIEKSTHVVDIHCGDGNESLRPYLYCITTGAPEVAAAGKQMAYAFGMDRIVVDRERPTDPKASLYLSNTAITRGKPALTVESGFMGEIDEPSIKAIERGVAGLLKELKMRATGPDPVKNPVLFERSEVLRSSFTGIWYPLVEKAQMVKAGALIGRVTDFHGKVLEEIKAPFAGEVLYVVGTPAMNKGEPVGFIGSTAK